jgi:predicted dehydrogenase
MAARYRVAVIGAGRPRAEDGSTGFGMAHAHAHGYAEAGTCDLVAVADIRRENAEAFAQRWNPRARLYADHGEMLAAEQPEIVSICTWPHLHAPMVLDCVGAGVRAIHCEKPMAPTWGEAKQMHRAAVSKGVQLTFNHQRRFLDSFRTARRLLQEGEVGALLRLEGSCPNMMDWGTHWLDMFCFFNEEMPAEWVLGQIDVRGESRVFGLLHESQAICQVMYRNGVRGLLFTGAGADADIGCALRLIASEGLIELHNRQPHLRLLTGSGLRAVETAEGLHGAVAVDRAVADLVRCLETGEEPELSSHRAIRSTEVIFATYESSRRRARIDLPLASEDSALLSMIEAGEIGPPPPPPA